MSRECKAGDTTFFLEKGSLHSEIMRGIVNEVLLGGGIRIRKESGKYVDSNYLLIVSRDIYEVLHKGIDYATMNLPQDEAKWYINNMMRSFRRYMDADSPKEPHPDAVSCLLDEIENLVNELERLRQTALYIDVDVLDDKVIRDRISILQHRIATRLVLVPSDDLLKLQAKLGMIAFKEPDNEHKD